MFLDLKLNDRGSQLERINLQYEFLVAMITRKRLPFNKAASENRFNALSVIGASQIAHLKEKSGVNFPQPGYLKRPESIWAF